MSSVKKRVDTGRLLAKHRGPAGKERTKDFDRKVDADKWLREPAAKVDGGERTGRVRGRVTAGGSVRQWLCGKAKLDVVAQHRPVGAAAIEIWPELSQWAEQGAERNGRSLAHLLAAEPAAGKGA